MAVTLKKNTVWFDVASASAHWSRWFECWAGGKVGIREVDETIAAVPNKGRGENKRWKKYHMRIDQEI